jgi:diketogulonate reductase-like aldo/keto reductase
MNHPGKVGGDSGVKLAIGSMSRLVMPCYDEGLELISCVSTEYSSLQLALRYKCILEDDTVKRSGQLEIIAAVPLPTVSPQFIPVVSLGTMKVGKRQCKETVASMIDAGFQAVDTAPTYNNEDKVGEALQEVLPKGANDDASTKCAVFVVAKVPKRAINAEEVRSELEKTLRNLKRQFVDILLLHWPSDVLLGNTLSDVWKCMEDLVNEGKSRALGVCNFNAAALTALLKVCHIPPAVNQVERHPLLSQMDLVDFCSRNNIQLQAHTPLGQGSDELLGHDVIQKISEETSMTPAQVVIQWNLQQGVLVVPRCTQIAHAIEILQLVSRTAGVSKPSSLSPKQMKALNSLDRNRRFVTPPFMYGTHPFCWGQHMPLSK